MRNSLSSYYNTSSRIKAIKKVTISLSHLSFDWFSVNISKKTTRARRVPVKVFLNEEGVHDRDEQTKLASSRHCTISIINSFTPTQVDKTNPANEKLLSFTFDSL